MTSGAQVTDNVKDLINEIKVYRESDLVNEDVFVRFMELLHPNKCRYILYDCQLETAESSPKKELVFVLWCPDNGCVKEKMNYAASKDALKKNMTGVKHNLQLNDLSDCSDRNAFAGLLGKDLVKLEGVPVRV